jgi:hypothetical protein
LKTTGTTADDSGFTPSTHPCDASPKEAEMTARHLLNGIAFVGAAAITWSLFAAVVSLAERPPGAMAGRPALQVARAAAPAGTAASAAPALVLLEPPADY